MSAPQVLTLDRECYQHNLDRMEAVVRENRQLKGENAALVAEVDRLNAALDRALPKSADSSSYTAATQDSISTATNVTE